VNTGGKEIRIVYITGRAHCGSTVVGGLLDNFPGVLTAGELYIIGRGEKLNDILTCTCGERLKECPMWRAVRERFNQSEDGVTWDRHAEVLPRCETLWQGLSLALNRKTKPLLRDLLRGEKRLYELIADEAGVETIVDTGRNPFIVLFLLANLSHFRVIHLVRNGEDFLYSKLHRMESGKGFKWYRYHWKKLPFYAPYIFLGAISWFVGNLLVEWVRRLYPERVLLVRYEDVCKEPSWELARIADFMGSDASTAIARVAAGDEMTIRHMYTGNPMAKPGKFTFRPDTGKPLPARYRVLFRVVAWPLMWKYGYFRRSGTAEA
jgi:hypothetical protein